MEIFSIFQLSVVYETTEISDKKTPNNVLNFLITTGLNKTFCEVVKLCKLVLTIPATSVLVKQSFSALKRIKSFIRNSTSEDRLSNLALISIEKQFVKQLSENSKFYDDVIDRFAAVKDRRIDHKDFPFLVTFYSTFYGQSQMTLAFALTKLMILKIKLIKFEHFWNKTQNIGLEPERKRIRIDNVGDKETSYRRLYAAIFDNILQQMNSRFQNFNELKFVELCNFNIRKIEKQITNRKRGVNGENISWLNTRDIRIVKEAPFSIYTKGNFNDDAFVEVDISKRTRGRPDNFFTQSDINALWPNGKPIAEENLRDPKSIWHLIPKDYLEFYSGLYTDGTVEDDLDGCGGVSDFETDN
ncbi:unnamed protein product [Psylliodes chrysocephalus]|uniref:HAT C-terminal dimerisation domain-containing protein n=1 Tax=Psylliodes chrysocephalus TaxID=3402493 RepID=A0A9P0D396_9CUCU|nr:unnamed protein product [Psylliodes chrysocephala]